MQMQKNKTARLNILDDVNKTMYPSHGVKRETTYLQRWKFQSNEAVEVVDATGINVCIAGG